MTASAACIFITTGSPGMMLDLPGFERALRGSPLDHLADPFIIGCVLTAVAASAMIAWYLAAVRRDRAQDGPVFRQLARAAGLSSAQQRTLLQLAQHAHLPSPATLLISAGYFDHVVRTLGEHELDDRQIQQLRAVLYRRPHR